MASHFRFRLERVLGLAQSRRRQRGAAVAHARAAEMQAAVLAADLQQAAAERTAVMGASGRFDLVAWAADRAALLGARKSAAEAAAALVAAQQSSAAAAAAYLAARQDGRTLERLRERHGARWRAAVAAADQRVLDDAGAARCRTVPTRRAPATSPMPAKEVRP